MIFLLDSLDPLRVFGNEAVSAFFELIAFRPVRNLPEGMSLRQQEFRFLKGD